MDFFKTVAGKVVGGLVGLAVVLAGISWFRMDPSSRHTLVAGTGKLIAWGGIVLLWPWVSFALIGRVGKMESNNAGAALVALYTALELALLLWLFDWHVGGAAGWTFVGVGVLIAAAYNVFTCDWIAEKLE